MISFADVLLPICCALVSGLLFLQMKRIQKSSAIQQEVQLQRIVTLENELNALSNASIGVGRKALEQDSVITALESKIEEIQLNDPAKVSYAEANRLVELGASIDEVMNSCGISRPEAELVSALSLNSESKNVESESENIPLLKEQV